MHGEINSTINVLPPFKRFCMTIGELPASYLETMTYYESLLWLTKYLQETVIPTINNNAEAVKELQDLYIQLQNYVNNYFDNLDIQEEINNKLDAMVEDGTLAEVINNQIFGNINLMLANTTNPIYYGADPTGVEDSTDAINDCIEANKGGTINFTTGTYKISNSILLPFDNDEKVSINGNGAKIITNDDIEYLFWVGYDRENDAQNDVGFPSYIKNLFIDGSNSTINYGVFNVKGFKDLRIDNVTIYRVNNGILIGEETGRSADLLLTNSLIYGNGSEHEGVGIIVNCGDNNINEVRIYGFRKGLEINGYITVDNTHVLLRWEEQTSTNFNPYPVGSIIFNEYYEQTNFADVNASCRITNSYADSVHKFLEIGDISSHVILQGAFYYNSRTGINQHLIDCEGRSIKLNVINCQFQLRPGNEVSIIRCTNEITPTFSNYSQITISGIEIVGISNLTNYCDIALSGYTNNIHTGVDLTTSSWKVVGFIANWINAGRAFINVFINGYNYNVRIYDELINEEYVPRCLTYNASDTDANYELACVRDGTILYVCLKTIDSNVTGIKINMKLFESTNLVFTSFPIYNDSMLNSDLSLSNFTNNLPIQSVTLKQILNGESSTDIDYS